MTKNLKWICVTALGIALFAALTLCLQVPVFENYYLCLGYLVMAVWLCCFGTLSGTIAGCLGVVAYCLLTSGLRGMPGWTVGNLVIGVMLGLVFRAVKPIEKTWLKLAICSAAAVIATALGILGAKSLTECLLYSQPFMLRAAKNVYAFIADAVVLLVGLPVCLTLKKDARRRFPELVV
ncbi:MAG: ECF transporter S component [Oscillospiraceae bacterium]|nr:ECF transporter S component [Oscillospiraceae bacterium]